MNNEDKIELSFLELEERQKIVLCTIPQHVPVTKNPDDETLEQIIKTQNKFLDLPINIKEKISSFEVGEIIQEIGRNFNLQLLQLADICRAIRSYYFGEIKLEDFPDILAREIPTDINTAQSISQQVIDKIIKNNSLGENKNLVPLSIYQALQQYPHLGEQAITSSPIKLKIFPQPVRPSIKNWIEDYRQVMGAQRHGMMERGNYLFHSENGKRITPGERKKLAEVLRSLDEDVALKIDPERQEIFFEINQGEKTNTPPSKENSASPSLSKTNSDWEERMRNSAQKKEIKIPSFMSEKARANSATSLKATDFFQPEKIMPESPNPIPSAARKSFSASYQANAGKPWEEIKEAEKVSFSSPQVMSSEKNNYGQNRISSPNFSDDGPKIRGNTVDLRN